MCLDRSGRTVVRQPTHFHIRGTTPVLCPVVPWTAHVTTRSKGQIVYRIDKQPYGYRLTFDGFIAKDEMTQWVADIQKALAGAPGSFGVFVDMRTLKPLQVDARQEMKKGQVAFKTSGVQRSVVILNDPVTTMQFRRLGRETGIDKWERYIDASAEPDWEVGGVAWLKNAKEP